MIVCFRTPPRPSPASVAYSDDETASAAKGPLPDDDDDSSMTEKPSEFGDSTEVCYCRLIIFRFLFEKTKCVT